MIIKHNISKVYFTPETFSGLKIFLHRNRMRHGMMCYYILQDAMVRSANTVNCCLRTVIQIYRRCNNLSEFYFWRKILGRRWKFKRWKNWRNQFRTTIFSCNKKLLQPRQIFILYRRISLILKRHWLRRTDATLLLLLRPWAVFMRIIGALDRL